MPTYMQAPESTVYEPRHVLEIPVAKPVKPSKGSVGYVVARATNASPYRITPREHILKVAVDGVTTTVNLMECVPAGLTSSIVGARHIARAYNTHHQAQAHLADPENPNPAYDDGEGFLCFRARFSIEVEPDGSLLNSATSALGLSAFVPVKCQPALKPGSGFQEHEREVRRKQAEKDMKQYRLENPVYDLGGTKVAGGTFGESREQAEAEWRALELIRQAERARKAKEEQEAREKAEAASQLPAIRLALSSPVEEPVAQPQALEPILAALDKDIPTPTAGPDFTPMWRLHWPWLPVFGSLLSTVLHWCKVF